MKTLVLSILLFSLNVHAQSPATLQKEVVALQAQVATLANRLNQLQANPVLAIGPFVSLDLNPQNGVIGPNITFKGVNIHIVSGSGYTTDFVDSGSVATGLGNLIIGYNEVPTGDTTWLNSGDRGASHMLIMGRNNKYTNHSFGGIVTGWGNTVNGNDSLILGGEQNTVKVVVRLEGIQLFTVGSLARLITSVLV